MLSRISRNTLRLANCRSYNYVNRSDIGPNEQAIPLFTSEMAPLLSDAKSEGDQLAAISKNSDLKNYMVERVPYLIMPQIKYRGIFHVIEMELYRESQIFKMTCLDVSKIFIFGFSFCLGKKRY